MRVITTADEVGISATVEFSNKTEHLLILEDEHIDGDHVFLWRTQMNDSPKGYVLETKSERASLHEDVFVWSLQWRGSLSTCMSRFGEVHGDLVIEQANQR